MEIDILQSTEEDQVILQLKVKHFIELEYKPLKGTLTPFSIAGCDCVIEKVLKERFQTSKVWEFVNWCEIISITSKDQKVTSNKVIYYHDHYGKNTFLNDQKIAIAHQDEPEYLIRELKLTKC